jgi:hypothetical protein
MWKVLPVTLMKWEHYEKSLQEERVPAKSGETGVWPESEFKDNLITLTVQANRICVQRLLSDQFDHRLQSTPFCKDGHWNEDTMFWCFP